MLAQHVVENILSWMAGGWGKGWRGREKKTRETESYLSQYCVISLGRMVLVRHLCFRLLIITYNIDGKMKTCFLALNYI